MDLPDDRPVIPIGFVKPNRIPIILVAIFGPLAWFTFSLRVYTRARILRRFSWDDLTMLISLLFFSGYAIGFVGVHVVVNGKHMLSFRQANKALTFLLVSEHFYTVTMIVLKISLALFFLRAVAVTWHKYVVYGTMAITTGFGVMYFFFTIFQCGTFKSISKFVLKKFSGQCVSSDSSLGMGYTYAAITAATDLIFAALPVLVLKKSQMSRQEKVTVTLILALAAIGSLASFIRLKYIRILGAPSTSFFAMSLGLGSWSLIELALGIIAGSLATLRPLFRNMLHPIRTMHSRTSTPGSRTQKSRNSNDSFYRSSIRRASILKPYEDVNREPNSTLWVESPPSTSGMGNWDRATLIEGPHQHAQFDFNLSPGSADFLSPLPRIANQRTYHVRDVVRHEMIPMMPSQFDRRNSCPS